MPDNWLDLEQNELRISFAAFIGYRSGQTLIEHSTEFLEICLDVQT